MGQSDIQLIITLEDGQVVKALGNIENSAAKTASRSEKTINKGIIGSFSGGLDKIKDQILALGGLFAAQFAVRSAISTFVSIEDGLIAVAKTTNLTNDELSLLDKNIVSIAKNAPLSQRELLDLASAAGQLGVRGVENLTLFSETIAKLGTASNLGGERAALAFSRILTITGEGAGVVDRLAASIVDLGNNFAAQEDEIADFTLELTRATAGFGLGSAELAGLATGLRSLGIPTESGATAISKAFTRIQIAVKDGGQLLNEFAKISGVTSQQFKDAYGKSALDAFTLFSKGLEKQGENLTKALNRVDLTDERALKTFRPLSQGVELVTDAINKSKKAFQDNTALNVEFERAVGSLSSRFQILVNQVQDAAKRLVSEFAPAIKIGVDLLGVMVTSLTDVSVGIIAVISSLGEFFTILIKGAIFFLSFNFFGKIAAGFISAKASVISFGASYISGLKAAAISGKISLAQMYAGFTSLSVGIQATRLAVIGFKAALSFGLTIVLDVLIQKVLEMKEEYGSFGKAAMAVWLNIKLAAIEAFAFIQDAFGRAGRKNFVALTTAEEMIRDVNAELMKLKETAKKGADFEFKPKITGPDIESSTSVFEKFITDNKEFLAANKELFLKYAQDIEGITQFQLEQIKMITLTSGESTKMALEAAKKNVEAEKERIKQTTSEIKSTLVGGISSTMQGVGAALARGENAWAAFGKGILGILGDLMIQVGTAVLAQALALDALAKALTSVFLAPIAIGAALALIALGGALKAAGGGGASAGGSANESPQSQLGTQVVTDLQAQEVQQVGPQINLTIQGNVLDRRQTGLEIADVLREAFDGNAVVFNT